jgi:hypothetical protein
MNTPKQGGSTDCGLYAIAIATALAHGEDPSHLVFHQQDMRSHLIDCLSNKKLLLFPVLKKQQRILKKVQDTVTLYLCPVCKETDYGDPMVCCDKCNNWFHDFCVPPYDKSQSWYCSSCLNKTV